MNNLLLQEALRALDRGWSVLPVNAGGTWDKKPHPVLKDTGRSRPTGRPDGSVKHAWESLIQERPTEKEVRRWFRHEHGKGLAVVSGQISGLFILDFDGPEGARQLERLGLTPTVRTGSGGFHVYVKHPGFYVRTLNAKVHVELGRAFPGVDVRGDGGYAILPPSCNNKGPYRYLQDPARLVSYYDLPAHLMEVLEGKSTPASTYVPPVATHPRLYPDLVNLKYLTTRALQKAEDLGRNAGGFWFAVQLRDHEFTQEQALECLEHHYLPHLSCCNSKGQQEAYTLSEMRASVQSAFRRSRRDGWGPSQAAQELARKEGQK